MQLKKKLYRQKYEPAKLAQKSCTQNAQKRPKYAHKKNMQTCAKHTKTHAKHLIK